MKQLLYGFEFSIWLTRAPRPQFAHTHTHRWWHKRGSARCERERSAEKRISILLIKKWRRAINGVAVLIVIVRCIDLSRFTQTHTHTAHADMGHVGRRTPSSRICTYLDRHRPCDFLLRFFFCCRRRHPCVVYHSLILLSYTKDNNILSILPIRNKKLWLCDVRACVCVYVAATALS